PGEIRTREDLIRSIWPEGTFVDYERGLNVAITRLRQVLGDSADAPRYIETLGRKGYRFVAPIERIPALETITAEPNIVVPAPRETPKAFGRWWPYGILIVVTSIAILAASEWLHAPRLSPEPRPLARLNIDLGPGMGTAGYGAGTLLALSRDGTRL